MRTDRPTPEQIDRLRAALDIVEANPELANAAWFVSRSPPTSPEGGETDEAPQLVELRFVVQVRVAELTDMGFNDREVGVLAALFGVGQILMEFPEARDNVMRTLLLAAAPEIQPHHDHQRGLWEAEATSDDY